MDKRNLKSVDFWKGITILLVLNAHTCFWSGFLYLPDWVRNLSILLEVPVFFFISGFLLQSMRPIEVLSRGARQLGRLLTDYAVVVITALVAATALLFLFGIKTTPNLHTIAVSSLKLQPLWRDFPVFGPSMWFIQVYLSLLPLGIAVFSLPQKRACIVALLIAFSTFIVPFGEWEKNPRL